MESFADAGTNMPLVEPRGCAASPAFATIILAGLPDGSFGKGRRGFDGITAELNLPAPFTHVRSRMASKAIRLHCVTRLGTEP